ncbi:MAG: tRNA (adenine-N1)-methyltransferase [Candidatus Hodarchaeales archaeon]
MLKEGDPVRITDLYSRHVKSWIIFLEKDAELSTHLGKIFHNELIGKNYGEIIEVTRGRVVLLRPTPRDFLKKFRLKTQIMYEDDCAIACSLAGLTNGMRVGEAGTGSGALTLFLANYVAPDGHVFSIDINEKHQENAKRNLSKTGLLKNIKFILKDIRQPMDLSDLDAFFLDFSTPFEAINEVANTLRGGGHLICFVPNWGQVEETFSRIKENPYLVTQEVFELTRRRFVVDPQKHVMRPVFRDLVYSGILIHSIKTLPSMG